MKPKPLTSGSGSAQSRWGYAITGAAAFSLAVVIQVTFDGLNEEGLSNMPALVAVPYGAAGKLGITIPLAILGLGLIVRDGLVNRTRRPNEPGDEIHTAGTKSNDEELETGEPLQDEPVPGSVSGRKIRAMVGGFASPATAGDRPVDRACPGDRGGQMVLTSARYMSSNAGGGAGNFRKGVTRYTQTEE